MPRSNRTRKIHELTPDAGFPSSAWLVELCLKRGLVEGSHHGRVDYRAGGKIVVNVEDAEQITIKLPVSEQQGLLAEYPNAVTLPGGWAKHGWTTLRFGLLPADLVSELVSMAVETVTG